MATAGPNSPSSASGWTNSTNVASSNDVYATVSIAGSGGISAALHVYNFSFGIPTGATVVGVTVVIERKSNGSLTVDSSLKLRNTSGAAAGTEHAAALAWATSDGTYTYGSSSDAWGLTLTDTDINHTNFGIVLTAMNADASSHTAYVDYVSITVDYTVAGQPMRARSRQVPFVRKSQIGW